jgi:hypothetical protein
MAPITAITAWETSGPETAVLEASGPETAVLEASGPETAVLEASGPETAVLETAVLETAADLPAATPIRGRPRKTRGRRDGPAQRDPD